MKGEVCIWIYEYKNDETPVGATWFDGTVKEYYLKGETQLPHLNAEWHWRIEIYYDEDTK